MQIVIDIPNTNYQVTLTKIMLACHGCKITELPKGHGRLIDEDAYIINNKEFLDCKIEYPSKYQPTVLELIMDESTIIEADKEGE